jgi:hypothetical protein
MLEYLPQALTRLSSAFGIAKTMVGMRDEAILNGKVIELQSLIIDAQGKVYLGQQEQAETVKKAETLQAEIKRLKDWSEQKVPWRLEQIALGVWAYIAEDDEGPFVKAQKLCELFRQPRPKIDASESAVGSH